MEDGGWRMGDSGMEEGQTCSREATTSPIAEDRRGAARGHPRSGTPGPGPRAALPTLCPRFLPGPRRLRAHGPGAARGQDVVA